MLHYEYMYKIDCAIVGLAPGPTSGNEARPTPPCVHCTALLSHLPSPVVQQLSAKRRAYMQGYLDRLILGVKL